MVSPTAMAWTLSHDRDSRTPYAPFSAEIMAVIPPDAAHNASTMPNVTFPLVEFLVTSSIVFERSSKAAGGSTSEKKNKRLVRNTVPPEAKSPKTARRKRKKGK